ncbi:MAG TPA: AsmA family protein, partial [Thalassobaculum sp.]
MRKLLIGLAAVVVVLLAAVLVVPGLIDWNGYKPEIEAAAKQASGRDLRLEGDIGLSVLPSPSLSVEKVVFANIPGGSVPEMARLEALRVHVALLPLLTGNVHVTSVTLVRPTVVLERTADGRVNWEFPSGDPSAATSPDPAEPGAGDGGAPAVALDSAVVEGGTVIYRDAAAGSEHRIENLDATVSAGGLQGPFEIDGSFAYQGLPVTLDGTVGALGGNGPSLVRVAFTAADKALTATVDGKLDPAGPTGKPAFTGDARIEAPDLGRAVERIATALGSATASPVAPGQAMVLTTTVA